MNPVLVAFLSTLILVALPLLIIASSLLNQLDEQARTLATTTTREQAQRARAVAAEQDASKLRGVVTYLERRVAVAEGWNPDAKPGDKAHDPGCAVAGVPFEHAPCGCGPKVPPGQEGATFDMGSLDRAASNPPESRRVA